MYPRGTQTEISERVVRGQVELSFVCFVFYGQVLDTIFELRNSVVRFVLGFLPVPLPYFSGYSFFSDWAAELVHFIAFKPLHLRAVYVMFWQGWWLHVSSLKAEQSKNQKRADNNSNHSHQQVGAGTPLRGARVLNVISSIAFFPV